MTDFQIETETSGHRRLSPAHWAVVLVTTLASWQVGQTVTSWVFNHLVPSLWQVIPGSSTRIADLVWNVLHVVLSAVIAAPLAYAAVQLLARRR